MISTGIANASLCQWHQLIGAWSSMNTLGGVWYLVFVDCVLVPNPGYKIHFHVSFEIVTMCQLQALYLVILITTQQGRFSDEKRVNWCAVTPGPASKQRARIKPRLIL